jgi:hypothetical protein
MGHLTPIPLSAHRHSRDVIEREVPSTGVRLETFCPVSRLGFPGHEYLLSGWAKPISLISRTAQELIQINFSQGEEREQSVFRQTQALKNAPWKRRGNPEKDNR